MDDELDNVMEDGAEEATPVRHFSQRGATEGATHVMVETGRNKSVKAEVGASFESEVDRIATAANYGGDYRVYLNGIEIINPEDAPTTIQAGMRIAITAYDKPGTQG
jgi:hypothetical protein